MPRTPSTAKFRRGAARAVPRRIPDPPRRVLLASPALPFTAELIERARELATPEHAKITVLGVAKVFGTSLGLPHPGLQPNRPEWERLRGDVHATADTLRADGFEVRVALSKSRNAAKMIAKWVRAKNFHAVVVPVLERSRWRVAIEGDLAAEVGRRSGVPVHAVMVVDDRGPAQPKA